MLLMPPPIHPQVVQSALPAPQQAQHSTALAGRVVNRQLDQLVKPRARPALSDKDMLLLAGFQMDNLFGS